MSRRAQLSRFPAPGSAGGRRPSKAAAGIGFVLAVVAVLAVSPGRAVPTASAAGLSARTQADDTPGGSREHEGDGRAHTTSTTVHDPEATHQGAAGEGGEGGEHAPTQPPTIDIKKLALQVLNFGVLVFILVKFGGSAINKALAARHHQLKADLVAAAELRAAAEAKLAKHEARLAHLEHEIAQMRLGLKADADAEKAQLIAAAEERAQRIKSETAFLMEQQVREAAQRLRRESADAALTLASEILRRAIGAPDQQRMLDTFVTDVEKAPPVAGSTQPSSKTDNGNGGGGNGNGNGNGSGREPGPANGVGRDGAPGDTGRRV